MTEISFYVFLPIYAFVIGKIARRARSPLAVELAGIGILMVIGFGSFAYYLSYMSATSVPPWFPVFPMRVQVFAFGMLLAVLAGMPWGDRGRATLQQLGRRSWIWWTLALIAFVSIPLVIGVTPGKAVSDGQQMAGDVFRSLVGVFIVIPVVLGPQDHGVIRRGLRSPIVVFLGLVSYGLYLWHYFILGTLWSDWLPHRGIGSNWIVVFVTALPPIIVAATASWYLVERPAQRASRRLTRR